MGQRSKNVKPFRGRKEDVFEISWRAILLCLLVTRFGAFRPTPKQRRPCLEESCPDDFCSCPDLYSSCP